MNEPRFFSPPRNLPRFRRAARLAICFGAVAAALARCLADLISGADLPVWFGHGVWSTGLVAGLLGYGLGRRPTDARSHVAVFLLSVLGAGAVNGVLCSGWMLWTTRPTELSSGIVLPVTLGATMFGVLIGLGCFVLPLSIVYRAHTRLGRSREGSLIYRAHQPRVWFAAAVLVLVFASISVHVALPGSVSARREVAVGAALVVVMLWLADIVRLVRFSRLVQGLSPTAEEAASGASDCDLGIGTQRWVATGSAETAYRSRPRVKSAVRGSVSLARRILVAMLVVDTIVLGSAIVIGLYRFEFHSQSAPPAPRPTLETARPQPRGLTFYPQQGPITVDMNDDGVEDAIGLSWDASHEDAALTVIAIDGRTLQPAWVSEPIRSQWGSPRIHLVRSGASIFLTDSEGKLRVYDLATGRQRQERPSPIKSGAAGGMCGAPSGSARAWLGPIEGGIGSRGGLLVSIDGRDVAAEKPSWCRTDVGPPPCGDATNAGTCVTYEAPLSTMPRQPLGYGLEEGDVGVGFGPLRDGPRGSHLVGYDPKTRAIRWEEPLAFTPDALHDEPHIESTLWNGVLFDLYQRKDGHWQLGARNAHTGEVLWTEEPPAAFHGTSFASMTATERRLYLVVDWRVDVFDVRTGAFIGMIW